MYLNIIDYHRVLSTKLILTESSEAIKWRFLGWVINLWCVLQDVRFREQ